jgi:hypothetical protein
MLSSNVRLRSRRHDAGAALVLHFRDRSSSGRPRQRRLLNRLHTLMLVLICGTAAALVTNRERAAPSVPRTVTTATSISPAPALASNDRIAPAEPVDSPLRSPRAVRLTLIEDEPETPPIARPASLIRDLPAGDDSVREETRSRAPVVRRGIRAALNLGDQASRSAPR